MSDRNLKVITNQFLCHGVTSRMCLYVCAMPLSLENINIQGLLVIALCIIDEECLFNHGRMVKHLLIANY